VTIPRYRGGVPEVRLYRAIGSLPRPRRLELLLDASSALPVIRDVVRQYAVPLGIRSWTPRLFSPLARCKDS
jgi:hypothetical protein